MTRLVPPGALRNWELIIRCIHQRGEDQERCLAELDRRGLWLSDEQRAQAGLEAKNAAETTANRDKTKPK